MTHLQYCGSVWLDEPTDLLIQLYTVVPEQLAASSETAYLWEYAWDTYTPKRKLIHVGYICIFSMIIKYAYILTYFVSQTAYLWEYAWDTYTLNWKLIHAGYICILA